MTYTEIASRSTLQIVNSRIFKTISTSCIVPYGNMFHND